MKKLLTTAAVCGLVVAASPAKAELELNVGGYFKGYGFYTNLDDDNANTPALGEARDFDIIRNTEVWLSGETVLDNGLTVGFHTEMEADGGPNGQDGFEVQESYAYFSGGWGRVNFGAEDGAAYLLQVAAPSADSNLDGIRQYVNPVNYGAMDPGANSDLALLGVNASGGIDYDQDLATYDDKLTYLSPIMNGFQLGLSYTPDTADTSAEDALNLDGVTNAFGAVYEAAFRYEGMFNNIGVNFGAGFSQADLERSDTPIGANDVTDDRTQWNVGLDLDIGPFGIGAIYMEDDFGNVRNAADDGIDGDEETFVVGVDYTTGPFKLGASYLDQNGTANVAGNTGNDGIETKRYTGGVVYTYGPGMTFRGSISQIDHDNVAGMTTGDSGDATSVLLGTQINF